VLILSRNSQHFMEPKVLLQCSQEPVTRLHHESDKSSPYFQSIFLISILISSSHPRLGLPSGSFLQIFLPKPCTHFSYPPRELHALPNSSSLLVYSARSTRYEAPHCAVFFTLLIIYSSRIQILSSAPCSQTLSVPVLPLISETTFHTHTKVNCYYYYLQITLRMCPFRYTELNGR
jgi:hypothetical protein